MASAKHPAPLTRLEVAFWQQAFLAAELPVLLKGKSHMSPAGVAHLAAEFADASIAELRLRNVKP